MSFQLETLLLGNRNGHDVRITSPLASNFDKEAYRDIDKVLPHDNLCESMVGRIETGIKLFDNVPYFLHVVGSELFYIGPSDAIGNRIWRARLYIDGIHEGYGERNYSGWRKEEITSFVTVTYTPWKPGTTCAKLVDTPQEYITARAIYHNRDIKDQMQVLAYRALRVAANVRRKQKEVIYVAAAD
jgi:hypothetical protein